MFIDLVGFSRTAERQTPREAFLLLKRHLEMLTTVVHKYGGTIDRSLGDGLLCFFGYSLTNESVPFHADAALACAIEIQQNYVVQTAIDRDSGIPLYPMRIGINTSAVYIGDLGNQKRMDFTLIGNGVNFASRLEAACEPFRIMFGAATHDLLTKTGSIVPGVSRRLMQMKHHEELLEVFELDPFWDSSKKLSGAIDAHRREASKNRHHQRWPVERRGLFFFKTNFGIADIVDFSRDGFAAEGPFYLAKDVDIRVTLVCTDDIINRKIEELKIMPMKLKVRWGFPQKANQKFRHGFHIESLNDVQSGQLLELCREGLKSFSVASNE